MTATTSEEDLDCGVNVAFSVVGSKWKPTILWLLAGRPHRFGELRRAVGDITEKVLSSQLKELIAANLVHREAGSGFPLRVDYSLTPLGRSLEEALEPLGHWGDRYRDLRADV